VETAQLLLLAVLMISSLLNIIYLLPIPIRAFFSKPDNGEHYMEIAEAPKSMLLAMIMTSTACVILFFIPEPFYTLAGLIGTGPVDPAP
jgi:multicomponent Na+:H+ antiporter subunit D